MPDFVNKVLLDHSQKKKKKKSSRTQTLHKYQSSAGQNNRAGYVNNNKDFRDAGMPSCNQEG